MKLLKKFASIDRYWWWLLFLFFVSSWSAFNPHLFRVHDYVHGARIAEMSRALLDGHFPVRWTENFGFGYGMPLFEFYAPLPYYIGSLIYICTNNLVLSVQVLFLIPNILSIIFAYKLGQDLFNKKSGLILATAFTLAPYRAVNLFVRGAISESWGIAFMPMILWAAYNLAVGGKKQETKYAIWLVAGWVGLYLSHNLSTLMFAPISLLWIGYWVFVSKKFKLKSTLVRFAQLLKYFAYSLGLAAFYLFPALIEKDFTQISSILGGYFHYSHHFLYIRQFFKPNWQYGGSAWGPDDQISFFLGYGQLILLFALGFWMLSQAWMIWTKEKNIKKCVLHCLESLSLPIFSGIILAGALFMTLLKSKFIWDYVPLVSFIQFPWRFLAVAITFLAVLNAYLINKFPSRKYMAYFLWGSLFVISLNAFYFHPEKFLDTADTFYYSSPERIRTQMSEILPDYIPTDLRIAQLLSKDENIQQVGLAANESGAVVNEASDEYAVWSEEVNQTQQKLINGKTLSDGQVIFNVASYPGWQAEINGQPVETKVTNEGLIAVDVPAGENQIGIFFGYTKVRLISDLVSLATITYLFYLAIDIKDFKL